MSPRRLFALAGFGLAILGPSPARAVFHLMQIEQVIAGVCGDTTVQAVQLRTRTPGQNLISGTSLVAYDAVGMNPVVLFTFPVDVADGAAGARILSVSSGFAGLFAPTPDFVLTSLIPESYLAAGRLTFEDPGGEILWSLAWGGSAYTGPTTGSIENDDDGDYGPPFDGRLSSSSTRALLFQGDFGDASTTNADDYELTVGDAQFVNNAGASGVVVGCLFADGFESGDTSVWSSTTP